MHRFEVLKTFPRREEDQRLNAAVWRQTEHVLRNYCVVNVPNTCSGRVPEPAGTQPEGGWYTIETV